MLLVHRMSTTCQHCDTCKDGTGFLPSYFMPFHFEHVIFSQRHHTFLPVANTLFWFWNKEKKFQKAHSNSIENDYFLLNVFLIFIYKNAKSYHFLIISKDKSKNQKINQRSPLHIERIQSCGPLGLLHNVLWNSTGTLSRILQAG